MNIASKAVLLGFFILFVLLIRATGYCAQPNFSFVMETDGRSGSLIVRDTGNGACHVTIQNIIIFDKETGRSAISEFEGDGIVKNGSIEVTSSNNRNCRLTIRLSNKTANVKLSGNYSSCSFGFNGSVDGDYIYKPETNIATGSQVQDKQPSTQNSSPKEVVNLNKNSEHPSLNTKDNTTDKPILGIQVTDFPPKVSLPKEAARIVEITPNTPAAKAGLQIDDLIIKVINKTQNKVATISNGFQAHSFCNDMHFGDSVEIISIRPDKERHTTNEVRSIVTIFQTPEHPDKPLMGIRMADFKFELPSLKGARVTDVTPNSPAATAGFQRGDLVINASNKTHPAQMDIANASDLMDFLTRLQVNDYIVAKILRVDTKSKEEKLINLTCLIFSMTKYPHPTEGSHFKSYGQDQAIKGKFIYEKSYTDSDGDNVYCATGLKTNSCTIKFHKLFRDKCYFYDERDKRYNKDKYKYVTLKEVIGDDETEITASLSGGVWSQDLDPCIWASDETLYAFHGFTEDYSNKMENKLQSAVTTNLAKEEKRADERRKKQTIQEAQKTPRQKALEQCYSDCFGMAVNYAQGKAKEFVDRDRIIRATESSCKHECDLRLKY